LKQGLKIKNKGGTDMKWPGYYLEELRSGPWPEIYQIRHGHGFHQFAHEMHEKKLVKSPRDVLMMPNHLIPLTPLGRWQCEETKKRLNIEPEIIYVSEMVRAQETASIIFPEAKIRVDWRLNEKEFGPAHLLSPEELQERFPYHEDHYRRDGKYFAAKAPGGENYPMMMVRAHELLGTLRRKWAGKTVVLVCHSAIMMVIRKLYEHLDYQEVMRFSEEEPIHNCGIIHYGWPNKLLRGWEKGRFRHRLIEPPYKLWELDQEIAKYLRIEAIKELAVLKDR
jgi:broad specificity phosphatase PhoE